MQQRRDHREQFPIALIEAMFSAAGLTPQGTVLQDALALHAAPMLEAATRVEDVAFAKAILVAAGNAAPAYINRNYSNSRFGTLLRLAALKENQALWDLFCKFGGDPYQVTTDAPADVARAQGLIVASPYCRAGR